MWTAPIPEELLPPPPVAPWLSFAFDAWSEMSAHRPVYDGGIEGPIAFGTIRDWCDLMGVAHPSDRRDLARHIGVLDREYLAHRTEERKHDLERLKHRR